MQLYCTAPICSSYKRTHARVKLRQSLTANSVYCAKMYVSLAEAGRYSIDGLQMYFDNGGLDTVSPCGKVISFVTAQVKNPLGTTINDTLNWIQVSGTFTATGNETYLTLGNFLTDAATTKSVTNSFQSTDINFYFIDDVSTIDYNLSAYAGPDKNINLGDSAFIGRPPEIGLECTWSSGTVTVGTGGGLWIKPITIGTFSYVVTQNICGNIKTDTVNVNVSPSSISETELFSKNIILYPQPAKDLLSISLNSLYNNIELKILDLNGKEIESKELSVTNGKTEHSLNNIANGVYILKITNSSFQTATKRLVISR